MTLRTRITLLTLVLLAVSLLVIGAFVYGTLNYTLINSLKDELRGISANTIKYVEDKGIGIEENVPTVPFTNYGQINWIVGNTYFNLYRSQSLRFLDRTQPAELLLSEAAYKELFRTSSVFQTASVQGLDKQSIPLMILGRYVQTDLNFVNADGSVQRQGRQSLIFLIGKSTESIQTLLGDFARTYTATALLVLIFGGMLAYRLVRTTLEPLEWVAKKAEQVSDKPDKLPELEGNNEVSSLVRSLNRMLTRLDTAWETQTRFLLDASHELRTPVTAILGHVGYLLRRTSINEQQRESLEVVKRESERMQKLVGDLLELSKGGSWKIELGPVHIATVLAEIQEEYSQSFNSNSQQILAEHSKGQIIVEAPEDLWVQGDPERLHQVFANLVSNAIKAGSTRVRLVARDLTERVVIRVEDNGEGIPPESIQHLFERFFRVDKARDRARGGSGLGLAIVRSIVEAHGGAVWAESELGRGSIFSISLKRAVAPQPQLV